MLRMESGRWTSGALPPIKLPLLYQSFASFCFAVALIGVILYSQDFTEFYYHPHILALTHLVTLGWITGNILGTFYMVGPIALQTYLRAGVYDVMAFLFFTIGVAGMATHFWLDRPTGMAWSAGCAYAGVVLTGVKIIRAIVPAKIPPFVRAHIFLGFINFFIAGAWGFLLAIHKVHGFLPTSSSPNVIAHMHLAAVGWATMILFGVAYRLLPMFMPAEPVRGRMPWIGAGLMEVGIVGYFIFVLKQLSSAWIFAVMIVSGIFLFLLLAIRQARRRKPTPPPQPVRPDFSMLQALLAFSSLFISIVVGLILIFAPASEQTLQWALAYGVLGLVGFLGQMVTALKPRILAIFAWYHGFSRFGPGVLPRVLDLPVRIFQISVFLLWLTGLPLMIAGIVRPSHTWIRAGATLLLAAMVLASIHECSILTLIYRRPNR